MPNDLITFHAFTITNTVLAKQLRTDATVFYNGKNITVPALWDTGATGTCISTSVANALGLVPTGLQSIKTPSGESTVSTYLVDIRLPNGVGIRDVPVCGSKIGDQGLGLLIGMDIIINGDFAISNYNGKTVFTFRIPSKQTTDYVKQITAEKAIGPRHGSGTRKKKR